MPQLTTAKTAEVYYESLLETVETQDLMIDKVDTFTPDSGETQNSGNVVWRPVESMSNITRGFDITGLQSGIIEESYPAILGEPANTFVEQRIDDVRDITFWKRQGKRDGRAQATEMNTTIVNAMVIQGSNYYRSNTSSGFDFLSEGQVILNEQQRLMTDRCYLLNDRDSRKFSLDLAGRQTIQGRPDETWSSGQIGNDIAMFDVYSQSFLPTLAGGADPATTVTGDQTFKPESGTVNTDSGQVNNVDYRAATIPVADSSAYEVGDKVTFSNGGNPVLAVGYDDKTLTEQAKTFTIVAKPSGNSVTVYPKPIALDDPNLSDLERSYANVDTQILNGATMNRQNITSAKVNLAWDKDAVEVFVGDIPGQMMNELSGKRVISEQLSNGATLYMFYDGFINNLSFQYRSFIWYNPTIKDPQRIIVSQTF